jgi:predicted membrane channel-forming protein YqfA (hemolysin III family)
MWLPRPIYEVLPYVYAALGALFIYASWAKTQGWRSALLLVVGGLLLLIGVLLWLRRRDFRDTQKHYNVRSLDE